MGSEQKKGNQCGASSQQQLMPYPRQQFSDSQNIYKGAKASTCALMETMGLREDQEIVVDESDMAKALSSLGITLGSEQ